MQNSIWVDASFECQNLLAWVLIAGGFDIDRGTMLAEKALKSRLSIHTEVARYYPFYALPEHSLGLACLKKGQYQKAIGYLEQAAQLLPDRPAIKEDLQLARKKAKGV